MVAVIGLIIGILIGVFAQPSIPVELQPYLPIMVVAAFDALVGAARNYFERNFSDRAFIVETLAKAGLEITRQAADGLTVLIPESGKSFTLRGAVYNQPPYQDL